MIFSLSVASLGPKVLQTEQSGCGNAVTMMCSHHTLKGFYYFKDVLGEVTTLMLSCTNMQAYLPYGFGYSCEKPRK